eukprot:8697431-Alexandrium_andersonii.AAC.1
MTLSIALRAQLALLRCGASCTCRLAWPTGYKTEMPAPRASSRGVHLEGLGTHSPSAPHHRQTPTCS